MVLRSDFSALKDKVFEVEYEWIDEDRTGQVLFENRPGPPGPSASTATRGGETPRYDPHVIVRLQLARGYECEITVDGATMRCRTGDGDWTAGVVVDVFGGNFLRMLAWSITTTDGLSAYHYLNEFSLRGMFAHRFDESLGIFDSVTASDVRAPTDLIGLSVRFEPEADSIKMYTSRFVPLEYRPARPKPGQSSSEVSLPHDSSLATFPKLARLKNMSMSFAVEGSQQEPDGLWWRFGHAEFLFSGLGGAVFNHRSLSYGQKRLLAFLYYLDCNPSFVIADELVNGLHHVWIEECMKAIGDRQAFLTSQNPLLLDYLYFESAEEVKQTFILCRAEPDGDRERMIWRNMTGDEADMFYSAYKVGVENVGEILRTRGFW
jgi:hypothetical protein